MEHISDFKLNGELIGIELAYGKSGSAYATLQVEQRRVVKGADTRAVYRVMCFGGKAEAADAKLKVGDNVIVIGQLKAKEYNDKWYVDLFADDVAKAVKADEPPSQTKQTDEEFTF